MRRGRVLVVLVAGLSLAAGQWANAGATAARKPVAVKPGFTKFYPLALEGIGAARKRSADSHVASLNDGDSASQIQCKTNNANGSANLKLDCDSIFPNNEPNIAVDPTDPDHMVGSSNDYDQCCDAFYTTFNGGKTWYVGDMSVESPGQNKRTGSDPVTTFDRKNGTVIHSSLNFLNNGCDGDVVVSVSDDGGKKWNTVVEVMSGGGCDNPFNDKEWITTDNNPASPHYGTTYLTWTAFFGESREEEEGDGAGPAGQVEPLPEAPIYEAHSTDGGYTWSAPQEISGVNPALCTREVAERAGACNDDQFSVPSVAPDGTVYVTYINAQNEALYEAPDELDDQYLMVKSSDGGATWSSPEFVVGLEDGEDDYPINVDGRQTLTNYQLRAPHTQGFVADPTHNGRLYLVFSDNRNGMHDVPNPQTETDVFVMVKPSAAGAWTGPFNVNSPDTGQIGNDQWFPWVDVNPTNGEIGVVYHDRRYTSSFNRYGTTFATSPAGGLAFTEHRASTVLSHPRQSVFFRAFAPGCKPCTRFHGDYIGVAYGSDGAANLVWTDMRDFFEPAGGYLQFIYYAKM
jgi:hypothetical protein